MGEGLCSSQSNPTTKIQTMVLGNKGDLFVGGAFQTRVSLKSRHAAMRVPIYPPPTTTTSSPPPTSACPLSAIKTVICQVWNGSAFVMVRDVAQFVGDQQRWLPLDMTRLVVGFRLCDRQLPTACS